MFQMTKNFFNLSGQVSALIIVLFGLSACSGSVTHDDLHFYSLTPLPEPIEQTGQASQLSLGVGPVEISSVLNRPQLVYRQNQHEIKIAENHQWAGSLREEIQKTLVDRLLQLSASQRVIYYPWPRDLTPDYQAQIRIERLDGELGGEVVLEAHWDLFRDQGQRLIDTHKTRLQRQLKDAEYLSYVLAQQALLMEMAEQIYERIQNDQNSK